MDGPTTRPTRECLVSLREVTGATVRAICRLSVSEAQQQFVAPNAVSIAEAYFARDNAWFRAIYAADTAVGFLMLDDQPDKPEYFLWRMMIDQRYQGLGFGRRAIDLLIDHVRTRPHASELLTSVVDGDGSPRPFYESLGFVPTGEFEEGEAILKLTLS